MRCSLEFLEKVRRLSDEDIARLALQELEREDHAEGFLKDAIRVLLWVCYLALSAFTGLFAYSCFEVGGIGGRLAATPILLFWAAVTWLAWYYPEIWTEDYGGGP